MIIDLEEKRKLDLQKQKKMMFEKDLEYVKVTKERNYYKKKFQTYE